MVIANRTELLMARRQIRAMIQADPVQIVLTRRSKVPAPGGGWRFGPETTLDPQTVTILPFKRRMSEVLVSTDLGEVPDLPYVVIGYPDLDIERGDTFQYNGDQYEVKAVEIKTDVRKAAQADYYGKAA